MFYIIDELHLTLCPLIIGGKTSQSFIGGEGFNKLNLRYLKLESVQKNKFDELILKYFCKKTNDILRI